MTNARTTPNALQPWAALGAYLRLLAPNARPFRYSCETCFRQLWGTAEGRPATGVCGCMESPPVWAAADDGERAPADASETFIICYDGTPATYTRPDALPNIHLDGAFSPLSLYTLLARQAVRGAAPAPPRWIVIDAHGRTDSGMFALAQIFAPHVTLLDADALECRGRTLRELMSGRVPSSPPGARQIEAAERHLQALLTAPGRRHAVSNIVGPVLLGFEPQQPEVVWAVSHLRRMLTDLDPSPGWDGRGEAEGPWVDAVALTAGGPVEFVLVDDQYRNGWGQVVCNALGAKFEDGGRRGLHHIGVTPDGGLNVSVSASAEFLLDKLERAGADDLRFGLRLGTQGCAREILLLDLRLFEGLSLREEAVFIARVAAVARARFRQRGGLPYPGFTDGELNDIDSWLERARLCGGAEADARLRAEVNYLRALALLPRVVALTDLSLPVVIFSSTGQREITELLKEYGSIITTFEKPRLFGYQQEDLCARTRASFRSAVERAQHLLYARDLCVGLLRRADGAAPAPRSSWGSATHLELYIDESGSSARPGDTEVTKTDSGRFVIAGLLVAYRETEALPDPAYALHGLMSREGLRWWPETPGDPYLLKFNAPGPNDLPGGRARARGSVAARFLGSAGNDNVVGICVEYREPGRPDGDLQREDRNDTRYRNVLSTLLELVLFELLPALSVNPQATLSIFVATRVRSGDDFKCPDALRRMQERWGYEVNQNRVYTVQEDAVLPILLGVLDRRSHDRDPICFGHVRGVRLYYPNRVDEHDPRRGPEWWAPKWAKTRHQHYVADLVAGACRRYGDAVFSERPWKKFFKGGTYDLRDRRLEALLLAARLMSRASVARALLELKNFDWAEPLDPRSGCALILRRLAGAVREEMTGPEFVRLAAALGEAPPAVIRSGPEVRRGTIKWVSRDPPLGCILDPARNNYYFDMSSWGGVTEPYAGESVEFFYRSQPDGRNEATWVKSLP